MFAEQVRISTHQIEQIDAVDDQKAVVARMAQHVLDVAHRTFNPEIAVAPRSEVERLFGKHSGGDPAEYIKWDESAWSELAKCLAPMRRYEAEKDQSVVQIIAAGVNTTHNGVFLIERTAERRHGKHLLWRGVHVEWPTSGPPAVDHLGDALLDRLRMDFHLQAGLKPSPPRPLGIVFTPAAKPRNRAEPQHVGVVFDVPLEEALAEHLENKRFKTRGRVDPSRTNSILLRSWRLVDRI